MKMFELLSFNGIQKRSIRLPNNVYERIDRIADDRGITSTLLIAMFLVHALSSYEQTYGKVVKRRYRKRKLEINPIL